MKQKDIIYAVLAAIILVVATVVAVGQLAPKKGTVSKANEVEIVRPFGDSYDKLAYDQITDSSKVRDFGVVFDLTTGLGNPNPFGK